MLRSLLLAVLLAIGSNCTALAQGFSFTDLGGAPASATNSTEGTAAQGLAGNAYDQKDEHTSDVTMTENNMAPINYGVPDAYYIQAPLNTSTSRTIDSNYQLLTERVPYGRTQTGLLAPLSVNMASFQGAHDLGFFGTGAVTGPGIYCPQGLNWTGADGSILPPTGTGEPEVDVTPGGGYF